MPGGGAVSGDHQMDVEVSLESSSLPGPGSATEYWGQNSQQNLPRLYLSCISRAEPAEKRKHEPILEKVGGAAVSYDAQFDSSARLFWPTCSLWGRGGWSWWDRRTRALTGCSRIGPALINNVSFTTFQKVRETCNLVMVLPNVNDIYNDSWEIKYQK